MLDAVLHRVWLTVRWREGRRCCRGAPELRFRLRPPGVWRCRGLSRGLSEAFKVSSSSSS